LLRKPRVQVVHVSLFKQEKKLRIHTARFGRRQMMFLYQCGAEWLARVISCASLAFSREEVPAFSDH
jgi:hypothetical protein